ncbi:MAG: hypothetical protein E7599_04395 [Ruminococcaceae bacterium]|nr:hypothetical protein [Oscillospiraceae bacterium]
MEVWRDSILIISVLGTLVFGYFLMARLDKYLDENRKAIEKEEEKKEPSCVMLTEEMSDEDIAEEVRKFRETHEGTRIILYDSSDTELSESIEYHTDQKQ